MLLEGRTIGLVEDDAVMGESLVQSLTLEGCHVDWWKTGEDALRALRSGSPDLVICDIRLPDITGEGVFKRLAATNHPPPFLFMTAYGSVDEAVSLMRAGAGDYVTKPFETGAFLERAKSLIKQHAARHGEERLGISPSMREVEHTLSRFANVTTPVLITGETGTGKEVCARFLHHISPRSKEPFIAVNCAAIPIDLIESELFGRKPQSGQSFHRGFAERARGGTLFLDEVCELPVNLQAKLLRLVETREFNRLSGEQLIQFHGRIVCATNADLPLAISGGKLREDFYYRVSGFTVTVPPLRNRRDDIPWLVDLFFDRFKGEGQSNLRGVSTLVYEMANEYGWPGNVRELRNRMERALAMTSGDWIMPADMFPDLENARHSTLSTFATLSETRDMAERRQIERALKQTTGQISEAARLLGISRTTLWEKMRRLRIEEANG